MVEVDGEVLGDGVDQVLEVALVELEVLGDEGALVDRGPGAVLTPVLRCVV